MNNTRVKYDPYTRYVYVDGVKICQYDPRHGLLLFFDKDKRRSEERGSQIIGIPLDMFCCQVDPDRCSLPASGLA